MRWFFDTEFVDAGSRIELISIGMVSESGEEYAACFSDGWDVRDCDRWLLDNVVSKLPEERKPRSEVAREIVRMVGPRPEFWGYFVAYDWVALCQLVAPTGRLIDLPSGYHSWPHLAMDLKQLMILHGIRKDDLPKQDEGMLHDSLADARWVRDSYLFVRKRIEEASDGGGERLILDMGSDDSDDGMEECGRRVASAIISYSEGNALSTTYRRLKDAPIGSFWTRVGRELSRISSERIVKILSEEL